MSLKRSFMLRSLVMVLYIAVHALLVNLYVNRLSMHLLHFILTRHAGTPVAGVGLKYFPYVLSSVVTLPIWLCAVVYWGVGTNGFRSYIKPKQVQ